MFGSRSCESPLRRSLEAATSTDVGDENPQLDGAKPARGLLERGEVVGRYTVLARLGQGSMGVVYSAYDPELDRKVALKLLLPAPRKERTAKARLQREAQVLAKLSHPNVVAVHDVGVLDQSVYIAMEFVEGKTVTQWLADSERSWSEVLDVFVQAARGLAAAHSQGVLHRDVKPDNLMVSLEEASASGVGRVRVMDFGLARRRDRSESYGDDEPDEELMASQRRQPGGSAFTTVAGSVMGTPAYMAPEQFFDTGVDERTDVFSLCVSLWESLYGERPFLGDSVIEMCAAVTQGQRRPVPTGRQVPTWLRRVVERGLSSEADQRWPSMDALLRELSRDRGARRKWWIAGGTGLALLGGTAGIWWKHDAALCTGSEAELTEVWDDHRRDQIHRGILDSGAPYAEGVWERISPSLDEWAQAWVSMHAQNCEATRRTGTQSESVMDLRMACLHRARQSLDATAGVLRDATPEAVARAHELVAGLPRLSDCADVGSLQEHNPPVDPKQAPIVREVRRELAEAEAQRVAGAYEPALAAAWRGEAMLGDVSYAPVQAQVQLAIGRILEHRGAYEEAEVALRKAQVFAGRARRHDLLREATLRMVALLGYRQQRSAEALALIDIARGLSTGSPKAEASVLSGLAAVLYTQGKYAEAEAQQRAALGKTEAAFGNEDLKVAIERGNLAAYLYVQGRYAEAEAEHRAALALKQKLLGPGHPDIATSRNNLAAALQPQGEYAEAEAEYRAALLLRVDALGEDHPEVARTRDNLALVLRAQEEHQNAEIEHRRALAARVKTLGEDHPDVATSQYNLAMLLNTRDANDEAESLVRAAIRLRRRTLGEEHPQVAVARNGLGVILSARGLVEDATREFEAAIAIAIASVGQDHPLCAFSRANLGLALVKLQLHEQAREPLEAAWAYYEDKGTVSQSNAARTAFALAQTLWTTTDDRSRSLALAERAADLYRGVRPGEPEKLREVELWLAERS